MAVRSALGDLHPGALVLTATSGGPDSMALAAALAFVAPRLRLRGGLVTVEHGLQEGSDHRARAVLGWAAEAGLDPREVIAVTVPADHGGPENAARVARYAALDAAAERLGAAAILLGHTQDDQAETVLLRLARGSGARSLAGMPAERGRYRRPFLGLPRATTAAACRAQRLPVWEDPANADPAYSRSRLRHGALRTLATDLGPGVGAALARTARLLRDDADALDQWAERAVPPGAPLDVAVLAALPRALRTRILRRAALAAGSPGGALRATHIEALDRLITDWRGQGPVTLPGGLVGHRVCGRLRVDARDADHPPRRRAGPRHRGPDPDPDH